MNPIHVQQQVLCKKYESDIIGLIATPPTAKIGHITVGGILTPYDSNHHINHEFKKISKEFAPLYMFTILIIVYAAMQIFSSFAIGLPVVVGASLMAYMCIRRCESNARMEILYEDFGKLRLLCAQREVTISFPFPRLTSEQNKKIGENEIFMQTVLDAQQRLYREERDKGLTRFAHIILRKYQGLEDAEVKEFYERVTRVTQEIVDNTHVQEVEW